MQQLLVSIGAIVLLIISAVGANAQSNSGALKKSYDVYSYKFDLGNGDKAEISLKTRFALSTIVGEPKVVCSGTWSFDYADIDGNHWSAKDLPAEVIAKLNLYDVDILYGMGRIGSPSPYITGLVKCDLGVFSKSGSSKQSFTTPASPSWDKTFRWDEPFRKYSSPQYYSKEDAKAHMKFLMLEKQLPSENSVGGSSYVLNAHLNVQPIRQYISQQTRIGNLCYLLKGKKRTTCENINSPKKSDDGLAALFEENTPDDTSNADNDLSSIFENSNGPSTEEVDLNALLAGRKQDDSKSLRAKMLGKDAKSLNIDPLDLDSVIAGGLVYQEEVAKARRLANRERGKIKAQHEATVARCKETDKKYTACAVTKCGREPVMETHSSGLYLTSVMTDCDSSCRARISRRARELKAKKARQSRRWRREWEVEHAEWKACGKQQVSSCRIGNFVGLDDCKAKSKAKRDRALSQYNLAD